jgi:hypothetical protein
MEAEAGDHDRKPARAERQGVAQIAPQQLGVRDALAAAEESSVTHIDREDAPYRREVARIPAQPTSQLQDRLRIPRACANLCCIGEDPIVVR